MSEEALRRLMRVEEAILAKRNGAPTDADESTLQSMRDFARDITDRAEAMWLQIEQAKAPNRTYDEALEAYVDACEEIGLDRDEAIAMAEGRIALAERLIPEARPFSFSGDVIVVPDALRSLFGSVAAPAVAETRIEPAAAKPSRQRRSRAAAETSVETAEVPELQIIPAQPEEAEATSGGVSGQEGLALEGGSTAVGPDGSIPDTTGGAVEGSVSEPSAPGGEEPTETDGDVALAGGAEEGESEQPVLEGAYASGSDTIGDARNGTEPQEASLFDVPSEDVTAFDPDGDAVPAEADSTSDVGEPSAGGDPLNVEGADQSVQEASVPQAEDQKPMGEAPAVEAAPGRRRLAFQR